MNLHPTTTLTLTAYDYEGLGQVKEGWGDHFPLRVAIHKRFVTGAWPGVGYYTELNHPRGHRIARTLRKGEWLPDQSPPATNPVWLSYPNALCPNSFYECGALIGVTYWLLAFDTCRVNYNGCTNGADIIRFPAGYQNSAWRLANSAYAYAIKNVSGDADIAEFHTLVSERYTEFYFAGYIDANDWNRVNAALGAHCLGPASVCDGQHRLPGSRLPADYTEKHALFFEAEGAQILSGGTKVAANNAASADWYLSLTYPAEVKFNIAVPAGTYRVHFVMKPLSSYYDEVQIKDPATGQWRTSGPLNQPNYQSAWAWRSDTTGGSDVTFLSAGTPELRMRVPVGHVGFHFDAIWLEKL